MTIILVGTVQERSLSRARSLQPRSYRRDPARDRRRLGFNRPRWIRLSITCCFSLLAPGIPLFPTGVGYLDDYCTVAAYRDGGPAH